MKAFFRYGREGKDIGDSVGATGRVGKSLVQAGKVTLKYGAERTIYT